MSLLDENRHLKETITSLQHRIKQRQQQLQTIRRNTSVNKPATSPDSTAFNAETSVFNENDTNTQNSDEALRELNVFPSTDWDQRLRLVKSLLPRLELEHISSTKTDSNRVIECTVISPLLFEIQLTIAVNSEDAVVRIATDKKGLLALQLLSNQYVMVVQRNYLPRCKIQSLMYSLDSLGSCVQERTLAFVEIGRKYADLVPSVDLKSWDNNYKIYTNLRNVDEIIISIPKAIESELAAVEFCLIWTISIVDEITGECGNTINLVGPDSTVNELFQMLITSNNSVVNSIGIVLSKCYKYPASS